jgi:hypothetical protein
MTPLPTRQATPTPNLFGLTVIQTIPSRSGHCSTFATFVIPNFLLLFAELNLPVKMPPPDQS